MLNNVAIIGRLTDTPELKFTPNGVQTTRFTVAITRDRKNKNGEYDSDFVRVIAWRGAAEFVCKYLGKGALVSVAGRIQSDSYKDKEGRTIFTTDIVAESVHPLETKAQRALRESGTPVKEEQAVNLAESLTAAEQAEMFAGFTTNVNEEMI